MSLPSIARIAAALERDGFPFLTWAEWWPGGHPEARWSKLHPQSSADTHFVHHSVTSVTNLPIPAAREINAIGISRFGKMSYPFLIHSNGTIIQGCYPYIGAHTKGYNSTSLAGCNIGNFEVVAPSPRMIAANGALIRVLRELGAYLNVPGLKPHRAAKGASTACPGKYLVAKMPEIARLAFSSHPPLPPIPTPATEESQMFFAKSKDAPGVWFFEPGRRTLIGNPTDRNALAKAAGISPEYAELSNPAFTALADGRERYQPA